MAKAFASKIRIPIPIGDETVIMICRKPTVDEQSRFLSDRYQTKGRRVESKLYEQRVALIDRVLLDVENAEYEAADGSTQPLNARTVLTDEDKAACGAALGVKVESWKDLIPVSWKSSAAMQFEDSSPEGDEKN